MWEGEAQILGEVNILLQEFYLGILQDAQFKKRNWNKFWPNIPYSIGLRLVNFNCCQKGTKPFTDLLLIFSSMEQSLDLQRERQKSLFSISYFWQCIVLRERNIIKTNKQTNQIKSSISGSEIGIHHAGLRTIPVEDIGMPKIRKS